MQRPEIATRFGNRLSQILCLAACIYALQSSCSLAVAQPHDSAANEAIQVSLRASPRSQFFVTGHSVKDLGKSPEFDELFFVAVEPIGSKEPSASAKPIMGHYRLDEDAIVFEPRFPLSHRVQYRVYFSAAVKAVPSTDKLVFRLPLPNSPAPKVTAVYPSVDSLPENLLKFYIHFSRPMSRGQAYQAITLQCDGRTIEQPFLELGEELWDHDQQRFTLFLHPGRIKRGLQFREQAGPAMEVGAEYTLTISEAWESPEGQPLANPLVKTFTVHPADRTQPDPARWAIETPKQGSQAPVRLSFDEPLDHGLLTRVILVRDQQDKPISGDVVIDQNETRWSFHPRAPWPDGVFRLEVGTILEDISGNSIAQPFERSLDRTTDSGSDQKIAIEFRVD